MIPSIRLTILAAVVAAFAAAPTLNSALAAGSDEPSPPASSSKSKDTRKPKKSGKHSSVDDPKFLQDYRAAYATIYERHAYADAIDRLKALDHDDRADVANLIGYSYRKLGNYQLSSLWYERALKADPNHVRTWQYYGLWQVEQGNSQQAQYHLAKLAQLAGADSEEYRSLARAIATGRTTY